ncbi:Type II secretion system protein D precursor [Rubripirellula lacrimiformis]|uniref:Type II secretion system protein D n=1 Tax=Rubripirellula lacrimiformis TaxID=1930273 RepID=A0A517NIN6_9BACT|nr:pilus assembly protein N-terminal domain-containing protein [Rubripirellula lacrimiformis]QDT07000.1 Type II secretion system protein D precursor [Rubripirellula lacrimiformis]
MEMKRSTARSFAAILMLAVAASVSPGSAFAQGNPVRLASDTSAVNRNISQSVERLEMLVKSSRILTLEDRIPKFQVHNEGILGATPISQNQVQIFAKAPGTTQLNLWDTNDKLYTVDVTVMPDAREVEGILAMQLPLASLKVLPINNSAIISGSVTNVDEVDRAVAIVEQFYPTVVNNIRVVGVQQILLHTQIMEVSRTKLRDLGIDWGSFTENGFFYSSPGSLVDLGQSTTGGLLPSTEGVLNSTNRLFASGGDFTAMIAALRRQDLIKFLAEPTVVATHGRPARFNVGGKVPYLVPSGNGSITVQYEEYGTAVDFLPFVVGPGRVRLEVRPEVSEPDASNGITASGVSVTAFRSRYVETAVELQAGQTFAIAGLLQSRTESVTRATPLLGELPFIGTMFRRVREERNDIELLITVTPEFVSAMDAHEVPPGGPGLNTTSPTDSELFLKGHIEVPNNLMQDCNYPGQGGYSTGNGYGSGIQPNEIHGGVVLPPGAIVPGQQPVQVGDGVTISAPE